MNFTELKKVHFIGIAGISMSALALYLSNKNPNLIITGSDINLDDNDLIIKKMRCANIYLTNKHSIYNITKDIDLVIYSSAINENNIEFQECLSNNIHMVSRSKLLSMIMNEYNNTICVAGTHGKTTTTSLLSNVMLDNNINPTIMVGGFFEKINGNLYIGDNNFFVAETCEYKNAFLNINSNISIILNIDNDHLDFFHDISDIKKSFLDFCNNTKEVLILNNDDKNINDLLPKIDCKNKLVLTFGKNNKANFNAKNVEIINGYYKFDVYYNDILYLDNIILSCPGEYNMLNALAVICLSYYLKIDVQILKSTLKNFKNSKRRFEIIKKFKGATLISDYAHHPSEIKAIYNAVKNMDYNKTICIFQPHTFSRTLKLLDDFIKVLNKFDIIILIDIYGARENNNKSYISSKNIANRIHNSIYITTNDELYKTINDIVEKKDLIIFMGAGDIDKLIDIF